MIFQILKNDYVANAIQLFSTSALVSHLLPGLGGAYGTRPLTTFWLADPWAFWHMICTDCPLGDGSWQNLALQCRLESESIPSG